jgi:DNA-binding LytR/AlgR family response regulator
MTAEQPTALIADDEPMLRDTMARMLETAWPDLVVVAQARNGREAIELFNTHTPDVCFLDVQMPGVSGLETARHIGRRAHLVFVTAYDQYAVQAFECGVLDYLVKPVRLPRLSETLVRLKERLQTRAQPENTAALVEQLLEKLRSPPAPAPLRWIRASVGDTLRMIAIEQIDFLQSDERYTRVAWRGDDGRPSEALVRTPLKDLIAQLDPNEFAQVHRSVVVNLRAISHITRGFNDAADIHLRGRSEILPVSRRYLHLFRQM